MAGFGRRKPGRPKDSREASKGNLTAAADRPQARKWRGARRSSLKIGLDPLLRKNDTMSAMICNADFNPASNRILNQMLHKAGYVTSRMKPLVGPLAEQSRSVLLRFMAGVLDRNEKNSPCGPVAGAGYGRP